VNIFSYRSITEQHSVAYSATH